MTEGVGIEGYVFWTSVSFDSCCTKTRTKVLSPPRVKERATGGVGEHISGWFPGAGYVNDPALCRGTL
jgi:hypothetical protein